MQRRVRLKGKDDLSTFRITRGTCDICGKRRVICVVYDRQKATDEATAELMNARVYKMLTWIDLLKYTILKAAYYSTGRGRLGVQCGCYAKLHRQIVHVATSVERKPGYKEPEHATRGS